MAGQLVPTRPRQYGGLNALFAFQVDNTMLILCDGGDGGWGGVGGCLFNAIDTLVYSKQTTHA